MKIAVIQLCSELDYKKNLKKIKHFLQEAKKQKVKAVFLPECFYSLGDGITLTPYLVEHENEHYQNIRSLALDYEVYLLGGSAATREDGKIFNRSYNFNSQGESLGYYDKIHLFSCEIGEGVSKKTVDEGKIYNSGRELSTVLVKDIKIGLSICFDLRFPWMYSEYSKKGVDVLSVSSAFTPISGKAHFHILSRARAIESQCFLIAACQWGKHNKYVTTYGHSLVVDPWGEVLADGEYGEKIMIIDLNLDKLNEVRKTIKMG